MTTAITPAYLAEFIHRVPVGARIPDGEKYVAHSSLFGSFNLRTSDGEHVNPGDNPCYTREPIPAPLPTESGSLVIAHTADDPTRRPFLLDKDDTWFGPGQAAMGFWYRSKDLIDPVPAKAVEAQS